MRGPSVVAPSKPSRMRCVISVRRRMAFDLCEPGETGMPPEPELRPAGLPTSEALEPWPMMTERLLAIPGGCAGSSLASSSTSFFQLPSMTSTSS